MPKVRFSRSLNARVMAYTGIIFLVMAVLIVVSILVFVFATEQVAWRARQREAAQYASKEVEEYIGKNEGVLEWLDQYWFNERKEDSKTLQAVFEDYPAFMEIIFLDANGGVILDAAQDKPVLANQFTILQSHWFLAARAGENTYSEVQTSPRDESYLIFSMPSQHGGVVAAQIQMDELWKTVSKIRFGESGAVFVIDGKGRVIAHPNPQIVLSNRSFDDPNQLQAILESPNNEWYGNAVNFNSVDVVSASTVIKDTGWIVITEMPQEEAYATSRKALTFIPIGIVFLMIVTTFVYREMVKRLFLRPLNLLRIGANQLGQGNLSHRIEIPHMDELGEVMTVFNTMAADLEKQQDNLQKAIAYEHETRRANELARSNAMILALSKVAALLENSSGEELILDTLGAEMKKLNLHCAVVTIDPLGETATIKYVSLNPEVIQTIKKLTGISIKDHQVPKRYWPGERIFKDKGPFWYPNPREIIRPMFPFVPDFIANRIWKFVGIQPEGQICILPLLVAEKVIGAMPIWGLDLQQADSPVLAIFASQVAGILQNAIAHENETRRANELAQSNSMILALSKVAAQLENSSNLVEIFETVGKELKKIGFDSTIGLLDDSKQSMQIRYISIKPEVIRWAEKATGHTLNELTIPRHLWPTEKVVTEKIPYWDPNLMKGTLNMFPILPERLHKAAMKMAGINFDDLVCYLPLANEQDMLGVLAVWGAGLKQNDVSALSILANQVTTAIRNSQHYEIEARRGREKEVLLKEIHHRVKNNLQIISSLLNLQSNRITDARTLQALGDSQTRVRSMALIHEKLYQSQSLAKIDFGEYVKSLATDLFRSYQRNFTGIQLNVQVDEVDLGLDQAVSCGLILNELMTNALKYAFPDGRNGTIWVELRTSPEHLLSLRVADDGVGIPADFDIRNAKSLGLQLVINLVGQLAGKMELERSEGTDFRVSFEY